jgi:hypothetical protein
MIKKLVTITALAMLFASSSTLIAVNVTAASKIETSEFTEGVLGAVRHATFMKRLELCQARSEVAGDLMVSRQNGDQMSDKINLWLEDPNPETGWLIWATRLAWEEPFWKTTENRQRAVDDFKNQIYTECFDEVTAEEK